MTWGFVYVVGNDSMPGIFKIGMTNGAPQERLEQLSSSTSVPTPFWMAFYAQVPDAAKAERKLHEKFARYRINPGREFFQVTLDELHDAMEFFADPPLIHDIAFEPEVFIERRQRMKQFLVDHFVEQNPDPYQWSRHYGFD
jgi:hypothetical protein